MSKDRELKPKFADKSGKSNTKKRKNPRARRTTKLFQAARAITLFKALTYGISPDYLDHRLAVQRDEVRRQVVRALLPCAP